MSSREYYKLLGVSSDASQDDIKKAFRKLSMKYHPDRNKGDKKAEEEFKKINEANSVLSDHKKRQEYDNPSPFGGLFGGPNIRWQHDGVDEIFGRMAGMRRRRPENFSRKGLDIRYVVDISINKFILGGEEGISIDYEDICILCSGKGFSASKPCSNCKGVGMITQVQSSGGIHMQSSSPCGACRTRGEIGTENCTACKGKGRIKVKKDHNIIIEQGSRDGDIIKYNGVGGQGVNGGPPGDLYIKLRMIMPKAKNLTEEQKGTLVDLFA